MKKGLLFICLFSLAQLLDAQLGLSTGYDYTYAPDWKKALISGYKLPSDVKVFPESSFIGLDLAMKSKKRGIQVLPELYYSLLKFEVPFEQNFIVNGPSTTAIDEYKTQTVGFSINLDVFPFSFKKGAKDHRLMMREKSWWKDAVFIRFGVGVASVEQVIRSKSDFSFDFLDSFFQSDSRFRTETLPTFRWGIGFDANVSSFLSISPVIQWTYAGKTNWSGFGEPTSPTSQFTFPPRSSNFNTPVYSQLLKTFIGIRLGVHFKKMSSHFKSLATNSSL